MYRKFLKRLKLSYLDTYHQTELFSHYKKTNSTEPGTICRADVIAAWIESGARLTIRLDWHVIKVLRV